MINTKPFDPLTPSQAPWLLFRVEHRDGPKLDARNRIVHPSGPSPPEFHAHLSSASSPNATDSFLSFVSTWDRAVQWYKQLQRERWEDITVIVVRSRYMAGVYDATRAALAMRYTDDDYDGEGGGDGNINMNMHRDPHRKLRNHNDEYLVYGNLPNDQDRILATLKGSGGGLVPDREVRLECSYYSVSAAMPGGLLAGDRRLSPLGVLEYEMYRRSGVRDLYWRDQLVKAIAAGPYPFTHTEYTVTQ